MPSLSLSLCDYQVAGRWQDAVAPAACAREVPPPGCSPLPPSREAPLLQLLQVVAKAVDLRLRRPALVRAPIDVVVSHLQDVLPCFQTRLLHLVFDVMVLVNVGQSKFQYPLDKGSKLLKNDYLSRHKDLLRIDVTF